MTTIAEKAAAAKASMDKANPSVSPTKTPGERQRIPLTLPQQRLEVPEIPGYHLHWFKGTPQRIAQALQAGYMYVEPHEIQLNNLSLGGDAKKDGNTDLGGRVSVIEGGEVGHDGQAMRLYLMKQSMEHYLEDQKHTQARNDAVADTLTAAYRNGQVGGAAPGEQQGDQANRYVDAARTKVPSLFKRKG